MRQEMTEFWDGSGISWTICKQSAPHTRQISTSTPHHSIFTGQMLFLMPNQQCQRTKDNDATKEIKQITHYKLHVPSWIQKDVHSHTYPRLFNCNGVIDRVKFLGPTHTRLDNGPWFRDNMGEPVPERENQSGFYWSQRQWVAVASTGPYASLHLDPDR